MTSPTTHLNLDLIGPELEAMPPQLILAWAAQAFGPSLAIVTSFQKTGVVTLHMLRQVAPDVPVLTLDTGNLFPETVAYIDALQAAWNLNLVRVHPPASAPRDLWRDDVDACCRQRKTEPLDAALRGYRAWVTGVRRDQSLMRAETPVIQRDGRGMVKLSPFVSWTAAMIDAYIDAHALPVNPLYAAGYASIGLCAVYAPGARWRGHTGGPLERNRQDGVWDSPEPSISRQRTRDA